MTRLFADPIPVRIERYEGEVVAVRLGRARLAVAEVVRHWRVDAEWWNKGPARDYLTLRTVDGLLLELFGDRRTGEWHLQRMFD